MYELGGLESTSDDVPLAYPYATAGRTPNRGYEISVGLSADLLDGRQTLHQRYTVETYDLDHPPAQTTQILARIDEVTVQMPP